MLGSWAENEFGAVDGYGAVAHLYTPRRVQDTENLFEFIVQELGIHNLRTSFVSRDSKVHIDQYGGLVRYTRFTEGVAERAQIFRIPCYLLNASRH
jgi:hypothetical protein